MQSARPQFKNALDEIVELQRLLKLEYEAEVKYYTEKVLNTPIERRVELGTCWHPVRIDKVGYTMGDRLKLRPTRPEKDRQSHRFTSGTVVALFLADEPKNRERYSLHGVISRVNREEMSIVFNVEDLPEWAQGAKLGVDLYFDETSYREMEKVLYKLISTDKHRIRELRDKLLGYAPVNFAPQTEVLEIPGLNPSQNAALNNALRAEDAAVIHGPPGTGKTTTFVQAIAQTVKREKQTLVCAPSNTAVDVLSERLAAAGVKVVRLGHPVRVSDHLYELTLESQFNQHPDYKEYKRLRRDAEQLRQQALKATKGRGNRHKIGPLFREADAMRGDSRTLEAYMIFDIIKHAEAICCTFVGSTNEVLGSKQFKTVFIDEAAQALAPASFIPMLRAGRVIFAGDHLQLPPTVKSKQAQREGLGESLMEKCFTRQLGLGIENIGRMLQTQYRMNTEIMQFSSRYFYDDGLIADEHVADHRLLSEPELELDIENQPLEFIDTAGCGFHEHQNPDTLSRFNPEEAGVLMTHLSHLLQYLDSQGTAPLSIGLIAPYRAQVDTLLEKFAISGYSEKYPHQFSIDTIDGFQGQERDIIYISLTRSNDAGEIGFLSDQRRMNVALTRARKKLVLVG
ncbi:MAG: AAA domain-containing protein, partial [Bacteroidota bacterium]